MVGVPRSKGCAQCVKRRVKCDQKVPCKARIRFHTCLVKRILVLTIVISLRELRQIWRGVPGV